MDGTILEESNSKDIERDADVSMKDISSNESLSNRGRPSRATRARRGNPRKSEHSLPMDELSEDMEEALISDDENGDTVSQVLGAGGFTQFNRDKSSYENEYDEAC